MWMNIKNQKVYYISLIIQHLPRKRVRLPDIYQTFTNKNAHFCMDGQNTSFVQPCHSQQSSSRCSQVARSAGVFNSVRWCCPQEHMGGAMLPSKVEQMDSQQGLKMQKTMQITQKPRGSQLSNEHFSEVVFDTDGMKC